MPLRRRETCDLLPAIVAEVLEVRALLSAGTAAVHQAMAHAAGAELLTPAKLLHPVVTPEVTVSAQTFTGPQAKSFSISQVSQKQGSIVNVHASFTVLDQNLPASFNGSFSGKVLSTQTLGNLTKVSLIPSGGSFGEHFMLGGKKVALTLVPQGTLGAVYLDTQGNFVSFGATYIVKAQPNDPPLDIVLKA